MKCPNRNGNIIMEGVREYEGDEPVYLTEMYGRLVIETTEDSDSGADRWAHLDLLDLIAWLKKNKPELLK